MGLTLTEFLDMARKWESEATKVNAYIGTADGPRFGLSLNRCNVVPQQNRIGMSTDSSQSEVRVALLADMTFTYSESAVLEEIGRWTDHF